MPSRPDERRRRHDEARGSRTAQGCLAGGLLSVLVGVTACAEPEEQSLCTVYAEYLETVRSLDRVDLDTATAGAAAETAEDVIAKVEHLGAVADARYTDQIEQLEAAVDDVLRVLATVDEDVDVATWEPLIEESVEDAQHAASRVAESIGPTCQTEPPD